MNIADLLGESLDMDSLVAWEKEHIPNTLKCDRGYLYSMGLLIRKTTVGLE